MSKDVKEGLGHLTRQSSPPIAAPSNSVERGIQQELMRHTCKVRIFSNIESLKCLVSDGFVEIDDKWVAAKKGYIKWELHDEWSGQI